VSAKLVHHTEDVVMPFVSVGGLIPMLSAVASWSERDEERARQKDKLAAQVTIVRGVTGSAPQFLLTVAYLVTLNQWGDFIAVSSATVSLIVAVYAFAAEAEKEECGAAILGGHLLMDYDEGLLRLRCGCTDLSQKAKSWLQEQSASLQLPHLWRGRALATYLTSDLILRAIAVCAVVSSWIDSSPTRQRETGAALLFGAVVFLLVSGALFPSGRESHGYVQVSGLRQSQQVGLALSLYSALFAPMTALILHFGSYALLELVASTSLAVGITLLYLPSLVPSFLGGVGLTLLLFALAAAKLYIFYQFFWSSFASAGTILTARRQGYQEQA